MTDKAWGVECGDCFSENREPVKHVLKNQWSKEPRIRKKALKSSAGFCV